MVILPGVPFLLEGTDAPLLIRALSDLASWVTEQSGYIETVGEGFAKMKELLIQNMGGQRSSNIWCGTGLRTMACRVSGP